MKKLLKILMYTIIAIISLLIVLIVVAKLSEDKITDIAVEKVSEAITAPMEIGDVSFTLIRRFPFATIEFNRMWLASPPAKDTTNAIIPALDTLGKIEHLYVSVRTLPLLKKKFEVTKVEIREANFNYWVDSLGATSFDFLIDTTPKVETDTVTTPLNIMLQDLVLKEIVCDYSDQSIGINAKLQIPQIKIKGEAVNNLYDGAVRGSIILTDCSMEGTNLYKMKETELNFDLGYADDSVSIDELTVESDGVDLNLSGSLLLEDEIRANISITETKLNIGELIKYAPEQMLKEYGIKKVSGNLSLDAQINGIVSDSILLPHVAGNVVMVNGSLNTTDYPTLKNINFIGHITNGILNNNQTTSLDFKTFHFETDQSKFDIEFSLQDIDHPKYNVKTNLEIVLSEFKDFIPDSIAQNVRGRINASLRTKGELPDSIGSDFIDYILETSRADIDIRNLNADLDTALSINSFSGQLSYKPNLFTASNLYVSVPSYKVNIKNSSFKASFSGKVSQFNSMGIDLVPFKFNADGILFSGRAKIKNLGDPQYDITSYLRINLAEAKKYLPDTLVNDLGGELKVKVSSAGKIKLDSISEQINDLLFKNSSIALTFSNVLAEMPDTLMQVENFTGQVFLDPDTVVIKNLNGIFSGIKFKIDSTKIVNLYNSVIKNQAERLYVQAKIDLGDLDYAMFLPFMPSDSEAEEVEAKPMRKKIETAKEKAKANEQQAENDVSSESEPTNWTYHFKGKLSVNSLTYNKAFIDKISAKFNITDTLYLVDQFKFNAFEGEHNTSVNFSIKDNKKILSVKNSIKGMNVTKLLKDFDNFKEYYEPSISYENISGIFTSRLDAQILLRNDSMIMDKFFVRADTIKLEKGGVYNYPPVQDVAQYLPGIDNLDVLEFKTINSQVFILQGAIYVPKTVIVSNKLDAKALGMQSFGEDYSYHFEVFLSDILSGKSKKVSKKQDKMGEEASDAGRKGTLVKSYSLDGKSHSGLDSKKDQDKMRITVNAAHHMLKLKFAPQLVKYDTGVK